MIGLVSLLVIGPEKLPKAARLAGFWVGKTRNLVTSVKAEIREELQAEEMRQILKEQATAEKFKNLLEEGSNSVNKLASSIKPLPEKQSKQAGESK